MSYNFFRGRFNDTFPMVRSKKNFSNKSHLLFSSVCKNKRKQVA
jgi:hypothetical protein